ncbi:FAD-dependent oxidoreductase [Neorickettsia sennetsu]|uniref:FAD-binding domain protein n=1 Tax=Ehrlichia sennetsu (strain ATCC VR-367 / Miyayama) TaxID=222891 RepID=Q2GDA7_EHRS3|nr:FAD-dependent oxidoreductase [Neorickettsia sennetsu]ABD45839.1 FAD-binding domain protein [Neorickettsia sennetsu str. Miyayama]
MSFGRNLPKVDELYDTERLAVLHAKFLSSLKKPVGDTVLLASALEAFIVKLFCIEETFEEKSNSIKRANVIHLCKRSFIERIALREYTKTIPFPTVKQKLKTILNVPKFDGLLYAEKALEWLREREKYSVELNLAAQYALYMVEAVDNADGAFCALGETCQCHGTVSLSNCSSREYCGALFHLPKKLNCESLIQFERAERDGLVILEKRGYQPRDGFQLIDAGLDEVSSVDQACYCLICHFRKKDTCRSGFSLPEVGYKKSAFGIIQKGCPLGQRISEMNKLYSEGKIIAALAVVTLDNPMCAATGHRICNDCMRSCIYQKQEPVNIPGIETAILDAVLELPFGFEIYSLLTRWNPLRPENQFPKKLSGRKVLISGSGPAGFTLAHYLINEGHTVVLVDGVKIESLPSKYTGRSGCECKSSCSGKCSGHALAGLCTLDYTEDLTTAGKDLCSAGVFPITDGCSVKNKKDFALIRDINELYENLDERVVQGFGGVMEYGITVRWNKNYLKLIRLLLERRENFHVFGGVRFGSNLTIEDCHRLGFGHIALCVGSGSPNIPNITNVLVRGVRFASDFLMTLHLGGAFKKDSMTCLQMRMPVVVVGGGLTAVDSATEALVYYKVQVEKFLQRYDYLISTYGVLEIEKNWNEEEKLIAYEFLSHARKLRTTQNKTQFLKSLGGVKIVYRKRIQDSPAYRINFEELDNALREGVEFIEEVEPLEILLDEYASAKEVMCLKDGKRIIIKARSVIIATGTKASTALKDTFPSWYNNLEGNISFFGDLDQNYAGSVVGAMASAKDKYRLITEKLLKTPLSEICENFSAYYESSVKYSNGEASSESRASDTRCHGSTGSMIGSCTVHKSSDVSVGGSDITLHVPNTKGGDENQGELKITENDSALGCGEADNYRVVPAKEPTFHRHIVNDYSPEIANRRFLRMMEQLLKAEVLEVIALTNNIYELRICAPLAARNFMPGQFYKLQNFHSPFQIEAIALTGSCVDKNNGVISLIVIEVGVSSYLCKFLKVGERVVLTGPLGTPTEIPVNENVLLIGGGVGNAVLFSVAEAMKKNGCNVLYFSGYKKLNDRFKADMIEAFSDCVVWVCDEGKFPSNRTCDVSLMGNMIMALEKYIRGEILLPIKAGALDRIVTIGSDSLMSAVQRFIDKHRHILKPNLKAIASINSPMQCMMQGICAQCIQRRHVNGKEEYVYSCVNQDQNMEITDFYFLSQRLKQNSLTEKLNYLYCKSQMEQK